MPLIQLKRSRTPLAGRGRFRPSFLHVDLPMTVGVEQLRVLRRLRSTSAAPDPMVDLAVLFRYSQRLAADRASSPLLLPEVFAPTVACPRLGQLPAQPCF